MSKLRTVFVALVVTTAACSPTTNGPIVTSNEKLGTALVPTTTIIPPTALVPTTTTTSGCSGAPAVGLAFLEWTSSGSPTRDVNAFPWRGFGPPWLFVADETGERGARFYLRADRADPRMPPSDGGGATDAATAAFARGVSLPPNAVFTGFATNWVELWLVPDDPDAAYLVPTTDTLFTEIERWPAMSSPGFCE